MVKNMRLIDADALKKAIPETTVDASTKYRYCVTFEREDVLAIIDAAPTVDVDRPTRSQFKRIASTANTSCSVTATENAEPDEWGLSARMTFTATEKGKPMRNKAAALLLTALLCLILCGCCAPKLQEGEVYEEKPSALLRKRPRQDAARVLR